MVKRVWDGAESEWTMIQKNRVRTAIRLRDADGDTSMVLRKGFRDTRQHHRCYQRMAAVGNVHKWNEQEERGGDRTGPWEEVLHRVSRMMTMAMPSDRGFHGVGDRDNCRHCTLDGTGCVATGGSMADRDGTPRVAEEQTNGKVRRHPTGIPKVVGFQTDYRDSTRADNGQEASVDLVIRRCR